MVKRRKRNSFIILASTLLLTGCGNSNLEITQNDILEVARDDANATKKECSNASIQEEKKYYTVSFDTTTGSYEYKIGKDGIIQERNYKRSNSEEDSTTEPVEEKKEETKNETETKKEETASKKEIKVESKKAVTTGDNTNSIVPIVLLGISLLGIYMIVMKKYVR